MSIWKKKNCDPKKQSTRRHHVNISFQKNQCNALERYIHVRIEIKTSVTVFYHINKLWLLYASALVIIFICTQTRTHILSSQLNTGTNVSFLKYALSKLQSKGHICSWKTMGKIDILSFKQRFSKEQFRSCSYGPFVKDDYFEIFLTQILPVIKHFSVYIFILPMLLYLTQMGRVTSEVNIAKMQMASIFSLDSKLWQMNDAVWLHTCF